MSAQRETLRPCLHMALCSVILVLTVLSDFTAGLNCPHPIVPEHVGFYCKQSPCMGFPANSHIYYFCESGYKLPSGVHHSKCHNGSWMPSVPKCVKISAGNDKNANRVVQHLPSVATTAAGVSIFILTTTACLIIKSRLCPCQPDWQSTDQLDLVVDGVPVSLPTYEEAVYGCPDQADRSSEPSLPPPYEERQVRANAAPNEEGTPASHLLISVEKDN